MSLPAAFLERPLAHRALHGPGVPENSLAAVRAAVASGYGIEIDVQLSADGAAMVFHDYDLGRLTEETGPVRGRSAAELGLTALTGGGGIPTLGEVLAETREFPVLIEIKDQDGALGPGVGPLERAVAGALVHHPGPVAVMSFNPHSVAEMARLTPETPRGLTTAAFDAGSWPHIPTATRDRLRAIPDYDSVGASFISHEAADLASPHVAALKDRGAKILCWTIRSPAEEARAREIADNITFEGYAA